MAESFFPTWVGIFVNPFYFARADLAKAMRKYAPFLSGTLLDVGCGTKPYRDLLVVSEYIGLDIDSEVSRRRGIADKFYDGKEFPLSDSSFDSIICNQVLEHVFNPDQFLQEIFRVMKPGGRLLLTVPFVWDEHEQPFDYARYTTFGLKDLLSRNQLRVIKHEKLGADTRVLFQLINAYLYKVADPWNKYVKLLFMVTVMASVNLIGAVASVILPKNPDMFLDHVILAEKPL